MGRIKGLGVEGLGFRGVDGNDGESNGQEKGN